MLEALTDDLNTPQAITQLHGLRNLAQGGDKLARDEIASSLRFFGLLGETAAEWAAKRQQAKGLDPAQVEMLITRTRGKHVRAENSPKPTASATNSPPWAWC